MSHFEQLDPDQRIVLRMAIRRRRSYSAMAEALGATPDEIRARALGALDALVPERPAGLSDEHRTRAADYLLGQQDGAAQQETVRLLGPSGPARTWALLVQERLASLGEPAAPVPAEAAAVAATPAARARKPRPERPDAEPRPRRERPASAAADAATTEDVGPAARPARGGEKAGRTAGKARAASALAGVAALLRRVLATGRGRAGAGVAAVVLVLVVLLVAGVFGGGGDDGDDAALLPEATQNQALAVQFAAAMPQRIPFRVPAGAPAEYANASGVARPSVSSDDVSVPVLALETEGLPAVSETRRYFVWADRNGSNPVFLGELPAVTGAQLPFQGVDVATRQAVIVDPTIYSRVRVTAETSANPSGPGQSVLVGTITPPIAK